jgi:hypothetical protein
MKISTYELKQDNLIAFITRSIDGKWIIAGGFDKRLHIIEE